MPAQAVLNPESYSTINAVPLTRSRVYREFSKSEHQGITCLTDVLTLWLGNIEHLRRRPGRLNDTLAEFCTLGNLKAHLPVVNIKDRALCLPSFIVTLNLESRKRTTEFIFPGVILRQIFFAPR